MKPLAVILIAVESCTLVIPPLAAAEALWSVAAKQETLRDEKGHKVGTVKRENGAEKIYDRKGHYQGQYREKDNVTRDSKGHKTGTGNQNTRNLDK